MSEHFDPEAGQPLPVKNQKSQDVAIEVTKHLKELGYIEISEDIEARIRIGEKKYGTRLKSFNGRDVLKDLLDELEDSLNYAKQAEMEGQDDGSIFKQVIEITNKVKNKTVARPHVSGNGAAPHRNPRKRKFK